MTLKLTFIYCIEEGELEYQTLLSIKSLRRFGGEYSNSEVLAICPRKNRGISVHGKKILNGLKANYIEQELNSDYLDNGCYNKPLVCSYAESICNSDYLIFLDSDTIILNQLDDIIENVDIQSGNVLVKNIGFSDEEDSHYAIWKQLFTKFKIKNPYSARPLLMDNIIGGYWNSGVLIVKNGKNIFKKWESIFREIMLDKEFFPERFFYFLDQVSWAILVNSKLFSFKVLDNSYNYHISNHKDLPSANKILSYKGMSIIHYHKIFRFSSFINPLPKLEDPDNKLEWIKKELKKNNIYPLNLGKKIKHLLGNKVYKIKQNIKK